MSITTAPPWATTTTVDHELNVLHQRLVNIDYPGNDPIVIEQNPEPGGHPDLRPAYAALCVEGDVNAGECRAVAAALLESADLLDLINGTGGGSTPQQRGPASAS